MPMIAQLQDTGSRDPECCDQRLGVGAGCEGPAFERADQQGEPGAEDRLRNTTAGPSRLSWAQRRA
jgi:hypothetical protein